MHSILTSTWHIMVTISFARLVKVHTEGRSKYILGKFKVHTWEGQSTYWGRSKYIRTGGRGASLPYLFHIISSSHLDGFFFICTYTIQHVHDIALEVKSDCSYRSVFASLVPFTYFSGKYQNRFHQYNQTN